MLTQDELKRMQGDIFKFQGSIAPLSSKGLSLPKTSLTDKDNKICSETRKMFIHSIIIINQQKFQNNKELRP